MLAFPVPLVPCIVPLPPFLLNVIVALQLLALACADAVVPLFVYPVVQLLQLAAPAALYVLFVEQIVSLFAPDAQYVPA